MRVASEPMVGQILPGVTAPNVMFTGQLTAAGLVANTTTTVGGSGYARVSREVNASPFVPAVACKCGARNPDNVCITGRWESMPFEAPTAAQQLYKETLWSNAPYMPVSAADQATMMRAAPLRLQAQPLGPMLTGA
jgi:hypothetical protein